MVRFPMFSFPSPFDGCEMKLRRADVNLRALEESIQSFVDDHPYAIEAELYGMPDGEITFYGRVRRDPIDVEITRWGAMVGDIVHNHRSCLDHLVWQATIAGNPEPVLPLVGQWKRVGFPSSPSGTMTLVVDSTMPCGESTTK